LTFENFKEEVLLGNLHDPTLHSRSFIEANFIKLEEDSFMIVKKLMKILLSSDASEKSKTFACFDLGEFVRLYPSGNVILNKLNFRKELMQIIENKNESELKVVAIESLQKLILKDLQTGCFN
jgi:V-type H+-transporting ATPase subunit H